MKDCAFFGEVLKYAYEVAENFVRLGYVGSFAIGIRFDELLEREQAAGDARCGGYRV